MPNYPTLFLRETPLTRLDPAIADLAMQTKASSGQDTLALLHALWRGSTAK